MAGVRSKSMFKSMILYILDSYNIPVEDKEGIKEKFNVNYNEINSEASELYLNWRRSGEILIGESISYDFKYSVLCLDGVNYIVLENYINKFKFDFLDEVELNLGILIFLFKEYKYYPKLNTTLQQDEVIDIIDVIDEDYIYHDFNIIKNLFADIRVFKVTDECPFSFEGDELNDTINRILALIFIKEHRDRRFSYLKDDTLLKYESLIMTDIRFFPYENILVSLLENKPSKVFLEIYRTIERLYPYAMITKFKEEIEFRLKDKVNLEMFLLEEALKSINWNHKEEDSISLLFEQLLIKETDEIKKIKEISADKSLKLSTWIYRIRNTIVHLSLTDNKKNVDIKAALESDEVINFIIPKLPLLYRNCFGDK